MKTYGLLQSQQLISIMTDDSGNPRIDPIPPDLVPLVKIPQPITASNQIADPILVWTETSVTRDWQIRDMTAEELAESLRKIWQHNQQFIAEFTMEEISAISLSTDPTIAALRLILTTWNNSVYSDDPRVIAGLDAIQTAGIITAERRVQILTK